MNGGFQLKPAVDLVYGHNGVRGNCVCLLNKTRQIGEGGETIWMRLMGLFHVIVNICWFKLAERFILVRFAINEKLRPFLNHTRFFKLTGQTARLFYKILSRLYVELKIYLLLISSFGLFSLIRMRDTFSKRMFYFGQMMFSAAWNIGITHNSIFSLKSGESLDENFLLKRLRRKSKRNHTDTHDVTYR